MRIRAAASRMRMKEIAIKSHPIKSKLLVYETQVRNLRKRLRRDPGANVLTPPHSTPPPARQGPRSLARTPLLTYSNVIHQLASWPKQQYSTHFLD